MNKNLKTISFAFAMFAVVGMISSTSAVFADDDGIELEAKLLDLSGAEVGEASFEVNDPDTELEIEIESKSNVECEISHTPFAGNPSILGTYLLDDEGELELVPSPVTINVDDTITVNCGIDMVFESEAFALDVDEDEEEDNEEDDDDDDDDDDESQISTTKKSKRSRR